MLHNWQQIWLCQLVFSSMLRKAILAWTHATASSGLSDFGLSGSGASPEGNTHPTQWPDSRSKYLATPELTINNPVPVVSALRGRSLLKLRSGLWCYYFIHWNKIHWEQVKAAKMQPMYYPIPGSYPIHCNGHVTAVSKVTYLHHPVLPLVTPQGQVSSRRGGRASGPGAEREATAPHGAPPRPGRASGGNGEGGAHRAPVWRQPIAALGGEAGDPPSNRAPTGGRGGAPETNRGGRCFEPLPEAVGMC